MNDLTKALTAALRTITASNIYDDAEKQIKLMLKKAKAAGISQGTVKYLRDVAKVASKMNFTIKDNPKLEKMIQALTKAIAASPSGSKPKKSPEAKDIAMANACFEDAFSGQKPSALRWEGDNGIGEMLQMEISDMANVIEVAFFLHEGNINKAYKLTYSMDTANQDMLSYKVHDYIGADDED